MSGKVDFVEGTHRHALIEGPTTAFSWLTILPFRGATAFDTTTGGRVMASLPLVGAWFGLILAAGSLLGHWLDLPSLLIATVAVTLVQLTNRFMHLDGMADVADALGSYGDVKRAQEILADPHAGLIGLASAFLALLTQIFGLATLYDHHAWPLALLIPLCSRICIMHGAHQRLRPLKPTGFGAMMIGQVRTWWLVAWNIAVMALAALLGLFWASPLQMIWLVGLMLLSSQACTLFLLPHLRRRLGGFNGDTCGFITEISTSVLCILLAVVLSM